MGRQAYHHNKGRIMVPLSIELVFQESVEDALVSGFTLRCSWVVNSANRTPTDLVPIRDGRCGARRHTAWRLVGEQGSFFSDRLLLVYVLDGDCGEDSSVSSVDEHLCWRVRGRT